MDENIFKKKKMHIYSKDEKISFEEFIKNIPNDYNGLVFKEIAKDTVGKSGRKSNMGTNIQI